MEWILLGALAGVSAVVLRRRRSAPAPVDQVVVVEPTPPPGPPYAAVLDALPLAVVVFDSEGTEVSRNRASVAFTGARHQDVLLDEAMSRLARRAVGGEFAREQIDLVGPPSLVVDVSAMPFPGGAVALMEDVTERQLVDRIRTDFVANVSHELRTPVGAISILAETLAGETEDELVKGLAARMVSESERMSRIIDDLLELSRIEMGGEMLVSPVDIADVAREALERVAPKAAREGVSVKSLVEPRAVVVEADFFQLVTAMSNLVENAVKYSEGRGTVSVSAREADGWVEVSVSDNGIGIPAGSLDRIFERFYRVDKARARSTGGTGLGLSIVRRVVTNHGGEVNVTSREGEGSTFTLRLPVSGPGRSGIIQLDHERRTTDE